MKPFGSARQVAEAATDARDDLSRMADDVHRAATVAITVLAIVGIVASVALIAAVSREA